MKKNVVRTLLALCGVVAFVFSPHVEGFSSDYDMMYPNINLSIENIMTIEDNIINLTPLANITKTLGFEYKYKDYEKNKQNDEYVGNTDLPELFAGYVNYGNSIIKVFFFNKETFDLLQSSQAGIMCYLFQGSEKSSSDPIFYLLNPIKNVQPIFNKNYKILGYWMRESFEPPNFEIDYLPKNGFPFSFPIEAIFGIWEGGKESAPSPQKEKILSQKMAFSIIINRRNTMRYIF
ncbi:MAG: hypothetical protein ACMUJM_04615 [bacterium]